MNLDKCLSEKRGCKDYLSKEVPLEVIGEVLKAGTCAPSAGNLQNWVFIVVTDDKKKEEISVACLNQPWMKKAPVHIVVCNDVKKIIEIYPTRGKLYATQACSIASQNIMLKASDLGLHSAWVGSFNEEAIKNILKIPEDIVPEMIITLGYCDEDHGTIERDSCDKVSFFNEYGGKNAEKSIFPIDKFGKDVTKTIQKGIEAKKEESKNLFTKVKGLFKKK